MRRFYAAGTWLSSSVALALVAVAFLAVPTQRLYADEGDCGCAAMCAQMFGTGTSGYDYCFQSCTAQCENFDCSVNTKDYCADFNTNESCNAGPTNCYTSGDGKTKCNCTWVDREQPQKDSCDCK